MPRSRRDNASLDCAATAELLDCYAIPYDRIEAVPHGTSGRSYKIVHGGSVFYIKLNSAIRIDALAGVHRTLANHELPAPKVVFKTPRHASGQSFIMLSEVKGKILPKAAEAGLDNSQLLKQAAGILERVHRIPLRGYGPLLVRNGELRGKHASWAEYLAIKAPDTADLAQRALVDAQSRQLFEQASHRLFTSSARPGRLLHTDYHKENILADNAGEIGIVDWDNAISGDPLYDLSNVWHVLGKKFELFMAGYSGELDVERFDDYRLFLCVMKIGLASKVRKYRLDKYRQRLEDFLSEPGQLNG